MSIQKRFFYFTFWNMNNINAKFSIMLTSDGREISFSKNGKLYIFKSQVNTDYVAGEDTKNVSSTSSGVTDTVETSSVAVETFESFALLAQ